MKNFLQLLAVCPHKRNYFGILSYVSSILSELFLLRLNLSYFLDNFYNCRVKSLSFQHQGRCLQKLDSSQHYCNELWEFDAKMIHI